MPFLHNPLIPIGIRSHQLEALQPLRELPLPGITLTISDESFEVEVSRGGRSLKINIPSGEINHNILGLIARDRDGNIFLCKQRKNMHARLVEQSSDDPFFLDPEELDCSRFRYKNRIYHAIICLNGGASRMQHDLTVLLDGIGRQSNWQS